MGIKQDISNIVTDIQKTLDSDDISDIYREQLEYMRRLLLQALKPEASTHAAMSILKMARHNVIDSWPRDSDIGDRIWNLHVAYEKLLKKKQR